VRLPDGPLRTVGTHAVEIHLHPDLNVFIKVEVVGEIAGEKYVGDAAEAEADSGVE